MIKNIIFVISLLLLSSCSKNNKEINYPDSVVNEKMYDTTAIDSFSNGAVSADVAQQIRMSSKSYRDSVMVERIKAEEARVKKLEEEKLKKQKEETEAKEKNDLKNQKSENANIDQPKK